MIKDVSLIIGFDVFVTTDTGKLVTGPFPQLLLPCTFRFPALIFACKANVNVVAVPVAVLARPGERSGRRHRAAGLHDP